MQKRLFYIFAIFIAFVCFILFFFYIFLYCFFYKYEVCGCRWITSPACIAVVNSFIDNVCGGGKSVEDEGGAVMHLGGTNTFSWHDEFDFLAGLLLLHVWHVLAGLDFGGVVLGGWLVGWTAVSGNGNFLLVGLLAALRADWQLATAEAQTLTDLHVASLVGGLAGVMRSWGWLGWSLFG